MAGLKLLATGGTGYMGGSIIAKLLASSDPNIKQLSISALVRKQEHADVLATKGVNAILFDGLDDTAHLKRVASEHDIVIHSANGFHTASAVALIEGLAERKKATGKEVYYIQTSGTSNLADTPLTGTVVHPPNLVFSDLPGSPLPLPDSSSTPKTIHAYLQARESAQPYPQRTTDLAIVSTGKATGVKTYIVMSPTVYGVGLGAFNTRSIQTPVLIRAALRHGRGVYVGDKEGSGTWDHVHVEDTVALYEILVGKLLRSAWEEVLPSGERGIYFVSEGRHTWRGLAELIGRVGCELGALEAPGPVALPVGEFAKEVLGGFPGAEQLAELGFASTAVTDAQLARRLGWKPQKTEADWEAAIREEFPVIWERVKDEKSA